MQTTYSNNSFYNFYNQGGSVTGFNASGVIVESKNTNIFSGSGSAYIPETEDLDFKFSGIVVSGTGESNISILDESEVSGIVFNLSSGEISYKNQSGQNELIGFYNNGEEFNLSGSIETGSKYLYLYLNQKPILKKQPITTTTYSKFSVYSEPSCSVSMTPIIRTSPIEYEINLPASYYAGGIITGNIKSKQKKFRLYDCILTSQDADPLKLSFSATGKPTGDVTTGGIPFEIQSNRNQSLDSISFGFGVKTSFGNFINNFSINELRNPNSTKPYFTLSKTSGISSTFTFGGNTRNDNSFAFESKNYEKQTASIRYVKYVFDSGSSDFLPSSSVATFTVSGTGINDFDQVVAETTGSFVTGISVSNSGFYLSEPNISYLTYNKVTSISFPSNNLFTEQCGNSIPFIFQVNSGVGTGASGNAKLVSASNIDAGTTYKQITGFEFLDNGTGYNYSPDLVLQSGSVHSSCSPTGRAGYPIFSVSQVSLTPTASYMNLQALSGSSTKTISGESYTGLSITGFRFLNIGSGYDSGSVGYVPEILVERGDSVLNSIAESSGFNFTGSLEFNKSGEVFSPSDMLSLETGLFGLTSASSIYSNGIYSGSTTFGSSRENFSFGINNSSTTFKSISGKITISTSDFSEEIPFSFSKTFNTNPSGYYQEGLGQTGDGGF